MNILIVGCGAIGGFYASRLYKSCQSVTVTARGEHLNAIKKNGLKVTHNCKTSITQINAVNHTELQLQFESSQFDLIIICLKTNHLSNMIIELKNWLLASNCPIMSLQNGVDSESILANNFGIDRVWGGLAIKIGGEVIRPGEIVSTGIAKITFGPWPIVKQGKLMPYLSTDFAKYLALASIPFELTSNIRDELWKKLIINNGVNPLSAITGLDTASLTHDPYYANKVKKAMQETAQAAQYDEVILTQHDINSLFELIKNFTPIKTSMLIDKENGRTIEQDAIVSAVIDRCQKLGIACPQNLEFLQCLTKGSS
jgi:2-dehydropantoate 2-reductase